MVACSPNFKRINRLVLLFFVLQNHYSCTNSFVSQMEQLFGTEHLPPNFSMMHVIRILWGVYPNFFDSKRKNSCYHSAIVLLSLFRLLSSSTRTKWENCTYYLITPIPTELSLTATNVILGTHVTSTFLSALKALRTCKLLICVFRLLPLLLVKCTFTANTSYFPRAILRSTSKINIDSLI